MALADNLLHYWNFDEAAGDLIDQVGSADGTNDGCEYGATGIIDDAWEFVTANTDEVTITETFDMTSDFTFSTWAKIDDYNYSKVLSFYGAAGRMMLDEGGGGANQFVWYDGAGNALATTLSDTSNWHHIVITGTINGANMDLELWVDGASVDTDTANANMKSHDGLFLGRQKPEATAYFDGKQDEMGWWSRKITNTEVAELYNSGAGLAYPFVVATNMEINIADAWKTVDKLQINIGDAWKDVSKVELNIGDVWKTIFG